MLCANLGIRLSRRSDRDIPRVNFTKGFSSASNQMGHEMAGCLLVKLFAMHTTYFLGIFAIGKKQKQAKDEQRLRNEKHIGDWILVVSFLLTWYQWMKQPTISKKQVKGSHSAVQCLTVLTLSRLTLHLQKLHPETHRNEQFPLRSKQPTVTSRSLSCHLLRQM